MSVTSNSVESGRLAENIVYFARALRAAGIPVGPGSVLDALEAVQAAGVGTRAMARQMSLSEHTIQDHLKSIFAKTDARDRVTVLSRALGTRREANRTAENSS